MKPHIQDETTVEIDQVRDYWEAHPLYSYEVNGSTGTLDFFDAVDRIRRQDVDRFSMRYWEFDQFKGRRILDVGCGPGWLAAQYARAGAEVAAVDLTKRAVQLTRKQFDMHHLSGDIRVANAERLPFATETFDLVVASGVLHHTPHTEGAVGEVRRVLKPGGKAKITLYRRGIVHQPLVFPVVRQLMRLLQVRHPGVNLAAHCRNADDFIRMYDGAENPIGRAYTFSQARGMFQSCGFRVMRQETHFFPARFVPGSLARFRAFHQFMDHYFGTMIYSSLARS